MTTKDLPSDKIYAKALSQTLTRVASPLTVGLYSSCNSRINMVLKNLEIEMKQETKRRERKYPGTSKAPRPVQPSLSSTLALIWHLLFYRPVWTKLNQDQKNVRFVFVRFSAWHFAGSDLLWAGLVMRLCVALQQKFGKLQLGLYRMCQHDEEAAEHKKVVEDSKANWRSKKICCFPLWLLLSVIVTGAVAILALLIVFGFPEQKEESEKPKAEDNSGFGVIEGFAIATLGVPAAGAVRFTFILGKNLAFNQDFNIRSNMDNKKVSGQLGFMNEVRKEMKLLSRFIHFMEVFERRKIRVVLAITNLDRCTPNKIVGVLDAVNILLSDEESPFISFLAVDPEVLVEQVKSAGCTNQRDQAFSFLDRIITLPFTVPALCDESKRKVFQNIVLGQSEIPEEHPQKDDECDEDDFRKQLRVETSIPLISQTDNIEDSKEDEVKRMLKVAFETVLLPDRSHLHTYLSGDTMSMRRVINSIRVTVIIMEELPHFQSLPAEKVAAWVVLADRWPCRLSWILQCIEDTQQRKDIDQAAGLTTKMYMDSSMSLWDVYQCHRPELHLMKEEVNDLLERDGDPELFEKFLSVDFKFTVDEAQKFDQSTVNLDISIKRQLGRVRGSSTLNDPTGKTPFKSLPRRQVIIMSTEDVCQKMSQVGLPDKYAEVVKSNHLNGKALMFNKISELKEVLQMTLGEWTTFKTTFLTGNSNAEDRRDQEESRPAPTHHDRVICISSPGLGAESQTTDV